MSIKNTIGIIYLMMISLTLIEDKIQKENDKLIHHWEAEGIRVEKARWGRHNIIKGK